MPGHLLRRVFSSPIRLAAPLILAGSVALVGCQSTGVVYLRPGISVAGIDVSGLEAPIARARVAERLDQFERTPLIVKAGDMEWQVVPAEAGLEFDVEQTIERAIQLSDTSLVGRFRNLTGSADPVKIEPVLAVDVDKLAAFIDRAGSEFNRPAEQAQLHVELDGTVNLTPGQAGQQIERDDAAQVLARAAATLSSDPVLLPTKELPITRTEADLAGARDRAQQIVGTPVQITVGEDSWYLKPEDIAPLIVIRDEEGASPETIVTIDENRLEERLEQVATLIDRAPRNARFDYNGGALSAISEGVAGRKADREELFKRVQAALTSDSRTIEAPVTTIAAIMSTDAAKLGIRELITEASTSYAGSVPARRHNVELAASRLNGYVLGPGETFSFNEAMGPATLDSGFQVGWGIASTSSGARTIPSVAGGICQVSTTIFQAVFWGGYQIEERNWHLYWIDHYGQPPTGMKGLDATVDDESGVNFKFVNNSEHYILIQARAGNNKLTFQLYGTKPDWTVKVDGPVIDQVVRANRSIIEQPDPSMPAGQRLQIEAANDGFRSSITRTVTQGDESRVLNLVSTYQPAHNVVLVGTKS